MKKKIIHNNSHDINILYTSNVDKVLNYVD